jgi:hypothetical protein
MGYHCKKKSQKSNHLLPERNQPHWQRQIQANSEKMEKDIPSKWNL